MKRYYKRGAIFAGFGLFALIISGGLYGFFQKQEARAIINRGADIYANNCASCHGVDLQGESDWQTPNPDGTLPAPPHDDSGHTWHHSDQQLIDYIKLGGEKALVKIGVENFKSGMPAYSEILDNSEINAVLAFIKSHWSQEILKIQRERTN